MFPLIFSCWRANSQTSSSHSDLPMVLVKCRPQHSPNKNEIKPNYFFHGLQPKALEQLSRKTKMAEERRIFPVSKSIEYFPVIPFCRLIRRTKGFPLFQSSICIYNNALPWQKLIILDFLGGTTSFQEYEEAKRDQANSVHLGFAEGWPRSFLGLQGGSKTFQERIRAELEPLPAGQRQPGCVTRNRGTGRCRSCLLSPARARKCGIKEGTAPPPIGPIQEQLVPKFCDKGAPIEAAPATQRAPGVH